MKKKKRKKSAPHYKRMYQDAAKIVDALEKQTEKLKDDAANWRGFIDSIILDDSFHREIESMVEEALDDARLTRF